MNLKKIKTSETIVFYTFIVIVLTSLGLAFSNFYGSFAFGKSNKIYKTCGIENLEQDIEQLLNNKEFFIAAIGDGMPEESPVLDRPYITQFAQGYDLFQGINHALSSKEFEELRKKIGVLYIDDGANETCAKEIGRILSKQNKLLGVIGHSTSSATKAALKEYKLTNIPFIIPSATNPDLIIDRRKNIFRLPANDEVQSLVLHDLITNKLKSKKIIIVWDNSPPASEYSEYIKDQVFNSISNDKNSKTVIEGVYQISINPLTHGSILRRIVSSRIDVLVFVGYGSMARELLLGLNHEYEQANLMDSKPIIVLTDGCKIPEISKYNFKTLITFPSYKIKDCEHFMNYTASNEIVKYSKMFLTESFEVYGYDAAILLLKSIESNSKDLSRINIAKSISRANYETCFEYSFDNCENNDANYYVYDIKSDSLIYAYSSNDISKIKNKLK